MLYFTVCQSQKHQFRGADLPLHLVTIRKVPRNTVYLGRQKKPMDGLLINSIRLPSTYRFNVSLVK
jgi:hypothetical protein